MSQTVGKTGRSPRRHLIALVVALASCSLLAQPVDAARAPRAASPTIKATFKGAAGKTLLVVAATGRVIGEAKINRGTQSVTVKTRGTSSLKGATLQLVTSAGGDYFGPVVISWQGTKSSKASRVYSKLKSVKSASLGTVTIKVVSASKKQGYAIVAKKVSAADTTLAAAVSAVNGKPVGVGTYGKNKNVKVAALDVKAFAPGDPCSPAGTPTCDAQGRELAPPVGGQPSVGGQAPVGGSVTEADITAKADGADTDGDGVINAFDVNDDGNKDDVVDSADSDTPELTVGGNSTGVGCEAAASFHIFTNFKATQPGYTGTINAYGTGAFEATDASIANAITRTMSMVFSPITSVCGSPVTATYLKGVGVPYAPSDFVKLGNTCETGDYQWLIGSGYICGQGSAGGSGAGLKFSDGYTFSATDLPSGQDTFVQKVETANGNSYEFVASVGFVFVTHPMIVGYSTDGTTYTNVNYSSVTNGPDGPTLTNASIALAQSQTLYLKIYRPQRLAIDGESGKFYDLGGFRYLPDLPNQVGACDALATTDSTMVTDTASDTTAKPTLLLTWAIGARCYGVPPRNASWPTGEMQGGIDIQVTPTGPGGNSAQKLFINAVR